MTRHPASEGPCPRKSTRSRPFRDAHATLILKIILKVNRKATSPEAVEKQRPSPAVDTVVIPARGRRARNPASCVVPTEVEGSRRVLAPQLPLSHTAPETRANQASR